MRTILAATENHCLHDDIEILCPSISRENLQFLVQFLYKGSIPCSDNAIACQILENLNKVFGFPNSMVLALPNNAGICRISVENNEVPVQEKKIEKKDKIVKVINEKNVRNDRNDNIDISDINDRNLEKIMNEDAEMTDDVILDDKNDKMTNDVTLNGKNDIITNHVILDDKNDKLTNEVPLIVKNYKMTNGTILDDKNDKMTNHVTLNVKNDKITNGFILHDKITNGVILDNKNDDTTNDNDHISDDIKEDITEIFNSFETTTHTISKPVIEISESESSDTSASLVPLQLQLRLHTCQYCNICQFKTFSQLNDHISSVHPFLSTIIIKPDIKNDNLNPTRTSAAKKSDWSTSIIESQSQVLIFFST